MSSRAAFRRAFALAATLLVTTAAQAIVGPGVFRAYLASDGSDANPCSLAQPCRLLPAALAAIVDGGEIWMLDSANFNTSTVTLNKSVSILAVPGAVGSVLAIGGPAITITAAGLNIALRNLVVAPLPSSGATNGVSMTGDSTLTIEHSLIANLPLHGVHVTGPGKLRIANTILRNNGQYAVRLQDGPQAEISGSQMLGNGTGGVLSYVVTPTATTTASVSDSIISGGVTGVWVFATASGATAKAFVTRSTIEGTSNALDCETNGSGSAILAVSGSTVVNNNHGWLQNGAGSVIRTLGSNHITDNTTTFGALTPTVLQ